MTAESIIGILIYFLYFPPVTFLLPSKKEKLMKKHFILNLKSHFRFTEAFHLLSVSGNERKELKRIYLLFSFEFI